MTTSSSSAKALLDELSLDSVDEVSGAADPPIGARSAIVEVTADVPPVVPAPSQRSKPAAMTVTRTSSPISSSMTAPKMMFASGWATPWMTSAASLTSNNPRSEPPEMFSKIPRAPSMDASSSGELIAARAAASARPSPEA